MYVSSRKNLDVASKKKYNEAKQGAYAAQGVLSGPAHRRRNCTHCKGEFPMETLNYQVLEKSGYDGYILKNAPEKVLQFGEGNFLRAFVDYWFDLANEKADWNGKCVLVQPIAPGLAKMINEQEGLYTLYLRGSENGQKVDDKRVISSVSRCLNPYEKADYEKMMDVAASDDLEIIVSNTTEAGIVYDPACQQNDCPPSSFPAKLTQVLYHRYKAGKKGIIMLACELIDNNGKELLKCVNQYIDQWGLEDGLTALFRVASATRRKLPSSKRSTVTLTPCWTLARFSACGSLRATPS